MSASHHLKPRHAQSQPLVDYLKHLEEDRKDLLTEDEYQDIRREFLSELTERYRVPLVMHATFGVCAMALLALSFYGLHAGRYEWTVAGGVVFLLAVWMWVGTIREGASKAGLSKDERLRTMDELLAHRLITDEEAVTMRKAIDELFATRT